MIFSIIDGNTYILHFIAGDYSIFHDVFYTFEDGTFDPLLFLFEHERELYEAGRLGPCLREIGRVLAIDGISVINFPNTGAEERELSKGTSNHPAAMEIISILSKPFYLNYLKIVKKELNLGIAFKRIR